MQEKTVPEVDEKLLQAQTEKEYLEGVKSIALTNPLPFNQDAVDTVWDEPRERSSGPCGPE